MLSLLRAFLFIVVVVVYPQHFSQSNRLSFVSKREPTKLRIIIVRLNATRMVQLESNDGWIVRLQKLRRLRTLSSSFLLKNMRNCNTLALNGKVVGMKNGGVSNAE